MKQLLTLSIFLLTPLVLVACGSVPIESHPDYAPSTVVEYPEPESVAPTGAIFVASRNITLFEDMRARQVGDIVTIVLAESTNAAKSSDTSLDKTNSNEILDPVLAGQTRVIGTDSSLAFDLSSNHSFGGESASNQRNSLQGSITVTVAQILPGGNLYVQGEKWIHINQGNEYIRLRGVIRPVDITTTNTILSTKVADARISYGGTGATAEVNGVGWLSRFFMSPVWPF